MMHRMIICEELLGSHVRSAVAKKPYPAVLFVTWHWGYVANTQERLSLTPRSLGFSSVHASLTE